jgi:hypothetical protein
VPPDTGTWQGDDDDQQLLDIKRGATFPTCQFCGEAWSRSAEAPVRGLLATRASTNVPRQDRRVLLPRARAEVLGRGGLALPEVVASD